jgi:signal transduction histidine kinase
MLRTAIAQTRFISHGLAPVSVTGAGLADALQRLAHDTSVTYGLDGRFTGSGDAPVRDSEAANQLFQIAIEAVHNAVRHGKPRHLWLELKTDHRTGRLEVRDDGRGLNSGRRKSTAGMGLRVMRHRAEVIGGRLTVQNAPGGGTLVRCDFENRPSIVAMEERHEVQKA